MAAKITFTAADVVRLLRLEGKGAVDNLVARKLLDVSAYTRRGQPLFDAEAVRRAGNRLRGAPDA